jgi:hypothetical protein
VSLECSLPLVQTNAATTTCEYDVATDRIVALHVHAQSTVGMTVREAVERLGIRPLCFGAAWKVVDLLMEHSLAAAAPTPQSSAMVH